MLRSRARSRSKSRAKVKVKVKVKGKVKGKGKDPACAAAAHTFFSQKVCKSARGDFDMSPRTPLDQRPCLWKLLVLIKYVVQTNKYSVFNITISNLN